MQLLEISKNKLWAGVTYFSGNLLNAFIPLLLLPILTRYLSPSDYGLIAMFGVLVSIYSAFVGLNTGGAVLARHFQLNHARLSEYLGACLVILTVSTAGVLLVTLVTLDKIADTTDLPNEWIFVTIFFSAAQFVVNIRLTLYQARGEAKKFVSFQLGQSILNLGLSLYLVVGINMSWEGRLFAQTITIAIIVTTSFYTLYKWNDISWPNPIFSYTKDALRFGVPLIPHVIGSIIFSTTDKLLIGNLLDVSQVGLYTVMAQLGAIIHLISSSFQSVYAPWLMSKLASCDKRYDKLIVKTTYLYFLFMLFVVLTVSIILPWFSFIVGGDFRIDSSILFFIMLAGVFTGMYFMFNNYIFFYNKTSYLAWVTLSCGFIHIFSGYYFIKFNGLIGAAQASALTQLIFFLSTWFFANKLRPMPWINALLSRS